MPKLASEIFRDFVVANVPSTGPNQPVPADIRDCIGALEAGVASSLAIVNSVTAALITGPVYATEAAGRAAVADAAFFKVIGAGDTAISEYQRTNSTTSVLKATYPTLDAAAPGYSLYPDRFFRGSAALGKSLVVDGKEYLPADGYKVWAPTYKHDYGTGAFRCTGNGSQPVNIFNVHFNAGATNAGFTTGIVITVGGIAVGNVGTLLKCAAKFYDAAGAAVGTQVGTKQFTATGVEQVIYSDPLTIPATATMVQIMFFSPDANFYVLDVDCTKGTQFVAAARQLLANSAMARMGDAVAPAVLSLDRDYSVRDVVVPDGTGIAIVARNPRSEVDAIAGFGQTFTTPGSMSFNGVSVADIVRGPPTTATRLWTEVRFTLRTHATAPESSAASIIAVASARIPTDRSRTGPITALWRDPVTGDLKNITHSMLLAKYGICFEVWTPSQRAYCGETYGTTIAGGTALAAFFTGVGTDASTATWSSLGSTQLAIGMCSVSNTTVTQAYTPSLMGLARRGIPEKSDTNALRSMRWKTALKDMGDTTQRPVIGMIGDSWSTSSAHLASDLANMLIARYGDGGIGWFGLGFLSSITSPSGDARGAYYVPSSTGTWTSDYHTTSKSPNICDARSSVATSSFIIASTATAGTRPPLTGAALHFTGTADGVIKWRWNGGAWSANTNVQTVGSQQTLSLTGWPTGTISYASGSAVTLEISVVSGSVILGGVDFKSSTAGAVLHKIGASGAKASDWTQYPANYYQWKNGFAALGCDTATVLLGVNDQAAAASPAMFQVQMETVIDNARAGTAALDVLVIAPPETPAGYVTPMIEYQAAAYLASVGRQAAFLNLQPLYGDPANPKAYNSAGSPALFSADNAHPNARSAAAQAFAIFEALTRG